jgi:hypothetical protein
MVRSLLLTLFLSPLTLLGQFTYILDESIPVRNADNTQLTMPWAGGLDAAQYNTLDLNLDDKDDLVIFDRMANKVITFINQNDHYIHAPHYEALFPTDISGFMLLRDFNCDGRKDLVTSNVLGIIVYLNTTLSGSNLSWQQYLTYVGPGENKSTVLLSEGFNGLVNIQLHFDDLPSITDVDGDGYLDILNMRYAATGEIEYHKNVSMELHGSCDSLAFKRITLAWGNVKECECGEFAFNGADCPPDGGRTTHSGGKSLLALDVDGDADLDLLLSEASCTKMYLLENEGTSESPVFNSSRNFPAINEIDFIIFPSAFYEDVDFDGVKDLIATPNISSKTYYYTDLKRSNWLYKNAGTTASPNFTFTKSNFLQEEMIDVGDNSVPAFTDYDGDGDFDMFISNHASETLDGNIALYENIGKKETPEFKKITDDYLNFSSFNIYNLKISFYDINGDNTTDLVFSGSNLQNAGSSDLYYLPNKDKNKLNFSGQQTVQIQFPFDHQPQSTDNFCVVDINLDGKADLLIGKNSGAVEYWKNNGALQFNLENAAYLGLSSDIKRQNIACTIGDLNADGKSDLLMSGQSGMVQIVSDFRNVSDVSGSVSQIVYNPITTIYEAHNLGGRIWSTVVNLYNTNKPAIVVGSVLGGVQVLRSDNDYILPDLADIRVFPNPTSSLLTVRADRQVTMQIFSALGQLVRQQTLINGNEDFSFDLSSYARGTYILQFSYPDAAQINFSGTPHVTSAFPALLATPFALLSDGILNHSKRKTISIRIIKN